MSRPSARCCRPSSLTMTSTPGWACSSACAGGHPVAADEHRHAGAPGAAAAARRRPGALSLSAPTSRTADSVPAVAARDDAGRAAVAPQQRRRWRSRSASCRRRRRSGCRPRSPAPAGNGCAGRPRETAAGAAPTMPRNAQDSGSRAVLAAPRPAQSRCSGSAHAAARVLRRRARGHAQGLALAGSTTGSRTSASAIRRGAPRPSR